MFTVILPPGVNPTAVKMNNKTQIINVRCKSKKYLTLSGATVELLK
jgi:hypothetical protein